MKIAYRTVAAFAAGITLTASACRRPEPPLPAPDQSYQVRGEIVSLPGEVGQDMYVAHEAIPQFVGAGGEVVGMKAMTMPFTIAAGTPLDTLSVGDKITFTFEVRWQHETRSLMRDVRVLPEETPLELAPSAATE